MKKELQNKDKGLGFLRHWKVMTMTLLLLTFSIGNVWAADTYYVVCNKVKLPLTGGMSGATAQLLKLDGTTLSATTDFSIETTGTEGFYYNSTTATYASFTTTSNYGTSSGSNRTMSGFKLGASKTLTIKLGKTSYSKLDVIYACGSQDKKSITIAGTDYETSDKNNHKASITSGVTGDIVITNSSNKDYYVFAILTKSTGGGGDPVDPVFTYTPATYTIGDDALDLSTKLSSTNTTGAITFAVSTSDAGTTGASITSNKNFTATTVGTATVTVSQAASTGYNAKSQDIEVTVVAPDPCTRYFWFAKSADATTAGKTNWDGFTITQSGSSNNTSGSKITIDGTDYAVSGRTSSNVTANIATFTVPANKAGKFYALLQSSGSTTRTIYLKQGDNTLQTLTDAVAAGNGNDAALSEVVIDNIPAGTYSVIANNNTRIGMLALKVCDATYHTITLDLNGGTGTTSIAALDGVPAYKPADPTKANNTFSKWVVKSTSADYNWSSNVTGDIELKAIWTPYPTLTLNAGEGSGTEVATQYAPNTEITAPAKPDGFSYTGHSFIGWKDGLDNDYAVGDPLTITADITLTAQWALNGSFDVKFFQGYGDPDAQIGETQSISTGGHAAAPTDPERAGFAFLGWSYDATEAHIVDVATYGITAATNFTAMWKAVWTVTFDGAGNVIVEDGETVASPNSPVMAGKIFQGWYNGEDKFNFATGVTGNLALESKWATADPNHFYYTYNDDFHFDGVVYKTPEGKTTDPAASEATLDLTTPYTVYSGAEGITSIVATNGIYDYKKGADTKHVTAYLKLKRNDATSNLAFTIKSGYTAVLKIKMGGYSNNPVVTLKKGDDAVPATSGTIGGTATGKNYNEITYNLTAGTYVMTSADQTLYISHIDLEATALPTHSVTYKPGDGEGAWVVDADATEVADCPGTFTAPTGKVFNGWKNESDDSDVAVGAIVEDDMNLIAQWINHYAVTFNMNDHGDAIDPQDIKHGAKATKPADPVADGFDFGGWFTDNGTFEAPFDFNTPITAATPLYAKWTADPCPAPFSLSKVVLTSASDGTVTGYNGNEYAGEAVIGGLKDDDNTAEVDSSHEGVEEGYKLNGGGSGIVFATLKKGNFQEGDRVIVTITAKQNSYKIEEVSQDVLHIYYGTNASDATKLTTLESVSTAGSYTYRLKAADITAIGTKKGIGVFRESSNGQNPYVYSVEIKGCRSFAVMHTLTFKNIDGTATIAAEPLEEGAYASTVAPAAPKITMKRFLGWAEAIDGTPVDLTTYTITEDKILYAVYEDIVCPTTGTVYKFQLKTDLTSGNIFTSAPGELTLNTTDHLSSMVNGEVTVNLASGKNTNRVQFYDDKAIGFANGDGASITLTLDCALATGDEIRFINYAGNGNKMNLSDGAHSLELNGNNAETVQKITVNSDWNGADELTLTRGGNTPKLTYFEIYRPAKYDVSFNMMGHGSAIADLEDVVEGSKIAAPSPAPTDVDYSFAGWYKENTLESEWDFDVDVVETNTTLYAKWFDKSDATLKSLKYGETDIVLVVDQYTYDITLPSLTSSVPALTAETNSPNATKVIVDGTFDGAGNATSTVTVTPEAGADKVYTVNFARGIALEQVTVTTSMEWDWSAAGVTAEINNTNTPGLSGNDVVIANVPGVDNDADFNSQALKASGTNAIRTTYFQGKELNIKTDKEGMLIVDFSGTNNKARVLKVYDNADTEIAAWSYNSDARQVQQVIVPAGKVTLKAFEGESGNNARIYNLKFYAYDTERADAWIAPGELGTICYPNGHVVVGADVYQMAGVDSNNKFVFDEVQVTEPGKPYLFVAKSYDPIKFYKTTAAAAAVAGTSNGMVGTFSNLYLSTSDSRASKWYYFADTKFYSVAKYTGSTVSIPANRAYVDLNEPHPASAPKFGVRRISFDVQGTNAATGFENAEATEAPRKVMINGTLFILRGEKMYDATGRLVK